MAIFLNWLKSELAKSVFTEGKFNIDLRWRRNGNTWHLEKDLKTLLSMKPIGLSWEVNCLGIGYILPEKDDKLHNVEKAQMLAIEWLKELLQEIIQELQ